MRKIVTKSESDKKKNFNKFLVGGILIAVMLFSTLGYAFQGGDEEESDKINYNGFDFVNSNGLWYTEKGNYQFVFQHSPEEVEKIGSEVNFLDKYSNQPVYVSSKNDLVTLEIFRNLNQIAQRIQMACLDEKNCEGDAPVKNCSDLFIVVEENSIPEIKQEENCVFIKGPEENLSKIADEFLFKTIGIEQ